MNYENMSDFEINKKIAELKFNHLGKLKIKESEFKSGAARVELNGMYFISFDPCNNPSDAWPIISSNAIDIEFAVDSLGGIGQAHVYVEGDTDLFWGFNDNSKALRAACIVYLMIQEA